MQHSARFRLGWKNGLITAGILVLATALGLLFDWLDLQEVNLYALFLLGILLTAALTASRFCSAVSALAGILLFELLRAQPRFSLAFLRTLHPMDFLIPLGVALLMGSIAHNSRRLTDRTRLLLRADQLFLKANGREEILSITAQQLEQLLNRPVALYVANGTELGPVRRFGAYAEGTALDQIAAQWTFRNGENSGARTARFARADFLYICIRTETHVWGVLGIFAGERPLTALENQLMQSVLSECTLALERGFYNQKRQEAALQIRNEKLRADLLRSISHDLRTPLTSISGNADMLLHSDETLDAAARTQIFSDIFDDAQWLNGLVENLLSITKIAEGSVRLHLSDQIVEDVITEALRHIDRRSKEHSITVDCGDAPVLARMDAGLIVQVLVNLVNNAIKYTPAGSHIQISARAQGRDAVICVTDDGPGIPPEWQARAFELFFTAGKPAGDSSRSLGLGLPLCRSIVEAHGGALTLADNVPHGCVFTFTLPISEVTLHE